jgi:hypothetical protein
MIKGLIEGVVGCVIGLALLPVVIDTVAGVNTTGYTTVATLLKIIPVLYVILIFVGLAFYLKNQNR